jgi:hypothetical protein
MTFIPFILPVVRYRSWLLLLYSVNLEETSWHLLSGDQPSPLNTPEVQRIIGIFFPLDILATVVGVPELLTHEKDCALANALFGITAEVTIMAEAASVLGKDCFT